MYIKAASDLCLLTFSDSSKMLDHKKTLKNKLLNLTILSRILYFPQNCTFPFPNNLDNIDAIKKKI